MTDAYRSSSSAGPWGLPSINPSASSQCLPVLIGVRMEDFERGFTQISLEVAGAQLGKFRVRVLEHHGGVGLVAYSGQVLTRALVSKVGGW